MAWETIDANQTGLLLVGIKTFEMKTSMMHFTDIELIMIILHPSMGIPRNFEFDQNRL